MPDLPAGYVAHSSRGRLRIRVPDRRRDVAYFTRAAAALLRCPGVEAVEVNARTASLLILHAADDRAIAGHARAREVFAMVEGPPPAPATPASDRWLAALAAADRRYAEASGGRGDLGTALAVFFVLVAAVQVTRGRIAMPAISALWYAVRALSLGRHWPTGPS